jgi:MFS family permease
MAYGSNVAALASIGLLYRYADFIDWLGGTEFHMGWIVGVGMIGSLAARMWMGSIIDLYGTRLVWLGSLLLLAATSFAHLAISNYVGVSIYLLRVLFCCAFAGLNGASLTFISHRAPYKRDAEVGCLLGDLLFAVVASSHAQIVVLFMAAGALALFACPFAWIAARSERRPQATPGPSMLSVVRQQYVGPLLVITATLGMGLGLPTVFVRPFAAQLGIPRIGLFFLIYAATAILTRVLARRWAEYFGLRRMILLGTVGVAASMATLPLVHAEWQLIWPAIGFGCFHAISYPAVLAANNETFPSRHRGLALLVALAAFDVGQLVGAPMAGAVIHGSELGGLPPYPTMFLVTAILMVGASIYYAWAKPRPHAKN